jgi:hypothetical protein
MKKIELNQLQEGCQHQMILSILFVENIRQEASVFFHMMWMGVVHLKLV